MLHEFSPIPGVVEDATDIILNLKQIPFKMMGEGAEDRSPARRSAGRCDSRPDRNRRRRRSARPQRAHRHGQRRRQARHRNAPEDAAAATSAPTRTSTKIWRSATSRSTRSTRRCARCNFTVEAARLGQMTDYDKLTLEVWTNGADLAAGRHRLRREAAEGSHDDLHQLRGRCRSRPKSRQSAA